MSSPCATATQFADRAVLEGVPKIGYIQMEDGTWEMAPFASSIRSALQFMGEKFTYNDIMALSGGAFRMAWNTTEWDPGNSDVAHLTGDPLDPFRRVFDAAGYEVSFYGKQENQGTAYFSHFTQYLDKEGMRKAILASIDRYAPVIAIGVIGPPECCVITGYDQGGDVLTGWNFWQGDPGFDAQPQFEDSGYFRVSGWYQKCDGIVLIGPKKQVREQEEIDRAAIEWAVEVMKQGPDATYARGFSGYTEWAKELLDDANFPDDNDEVLLNRMIVVDDASMILAGRGEAARWLARAAKRMTASAGHLMAAADLFSEEEKAATKIWDLMGKFEPRQKSLAERRARAQIASILLETRDLDMKALPHLEAALKEL